MFIGNNEGEGEWGMKIKNFDKLLGIRTEGEQKGFLKSVHYHRYEPTPYEAIGELLIHYDINADVRIVDFGCGKGRLNFILHYLCDATVIGIEMNETFYKEALANVEGYVTTTKRQVENLYFHNCLAEEYSIHPSDQIFYFFNPFTVQIFIKVVNRIMLSVYETERDVDIILYYPSADYIYFLENETNFELMKEISLQNLYSHNENERFLVYRLKHYR